MPIRRYERINDRAKVRQAAILRMRRQRMTLREIGAIVGICASRVRQQSMKAEKREREMLAVYSPVVFSMQDLVACAIAFGFIRNAS